VANQFSLKIRKNEENRQFSHATFGLGLDAPSLHWPILVVHHGLRNNIGRTGCGTAAKSPERPEFSLHQELEDSCVLAP